MARRVKLKVRQADHWEVGVCGDGHTVLSLLDRGGNIFAQAHGFDPSRLIFALLTGGDDCLVLVIERLKELLTEVRSDLASAKKKKAAEAGAPA
jgi:hypothetical protein